MGVLPLQFYKGDSVESLALSGHERFTIAGLDALNRGELPKELSVTATSDDDSVTEFRVVVRIDTPDGGRVLPPRRDPPLRAAPDGRVRLVAAGLRVEGPIARPPTF